MPETDIRTLISLEADDSGVDAARKALKQVVKDQETLIDAFKRGEKDVDSFNKELASLEKREKGLAGAIDKVTGEFTEQAAAVRELADETAQLAKDQEELSTAQVRFDAVQREVALADDAAANLRIAGGILAKQAGGPVRRAVSTASEIPALIAALPKLKEAAAGLPQAALSAATSLGPVGIGVAAVLAVGAIVAGKFAEAQAKAQAIEEARGQALVDINIRIATGDLTLARASEELLRLRQEETGILESIETKQEEYNKALLENGENWTRLTRLISGTEEGLFNTLTDYDERLQENATQQEGLIEAIENGSLAAGEAATAEDILAQARAQLPSDAKKLADALKKQGAATINAANSTAQAIDTIRKAVKTFGPGTRSIDANVIRRQIAEAARGRPSGGARPSGGGAVAAGVNDILNAQVDLNNALADARQDTVDRLEDLQQTFRDNINDAFTEGNFLDISKLQKERKRSERDLLRDEKRDFRDIREDGNAEILRLTQENNARRLQIEAQGMQASLNNHRQFWAVAGAISASALRLGGGRRRITAGFTGRTSFQTAPRTS